MGQQVATLALLAALLSLALRPEMIWGGPRLIHGWGVQQTLIAAGLMVNAIAYGVRPTVNWPVLALAVVLALNLLFGNLHPKLTLPIMLVELALLALPFSFTQVVLAPGSRRAYALVIAATPALSVALGGLLHLAEIRPVFDLEAWQGAYFRLEGGTGNAAVFAMLAFAGFVAAVHEMTRPGRPFAAPLALLNFVLVILSGTRMAIFASTLYLAVYGVLSRDLRHLLLQRHRNATLLGAFLVVGTLVLYWPTLENRMFVDDTAEIALSGRDRMWTFMYEEIWLSPLFGRGLGAGFAAASEWFTWTLPVPHNEYVRLLVIGGVVGGPLILGAIVLWYRSLLKVASDNDRIVLLALVPALAAYAITDNLLTYSSALALYAYLSVLMTRPPTTVPMYWQLDRVEPDRTTMAGIHPPRPPERHR